MYPMKNARCHDHRMISRGKHLHPFRAKAEGHRQHPLCQLHTGFTPPPHVWVSVQFCSIHSSPHTPTGHLLHQMHAGISQPDRLNRWSAQTVCLYAANMPNRFKIWVWRKLQTLQIAILFYKAQQILTKSYCLFSYCVCTDSNQVSVCVRWMQSVLSVYLSGLWPWL